MKIQASPLPGCHIVDFTPMADKRGAFMRAFDKAAFAAHGLDTEIDHVAEATNPARLTLRGLHFQALPAPESKLVRCVDGAIFDVAVDIRPDSPTRGQWFGSLLSADTPRALFIGKGFAHGYLTLSERTTVSYLLFAAHAPQFSRGIRWDDPDLAIDWPARPVLIGERDISLPFFSALDETELFKQNALP